MKLRRMGLVLAAMLIFGCADSGGSAVESPRATPSTIAGPVATETRGPPRLEFQGVVSQGSLLAPVELFHPIVLSTQLPAEFINGTAPGSRAEYIPYRFAIRGYDLTAVPDSALNTGLARPLAAFWARNGQELIVFLNPDLRSGSYPISLSLPSGQRLDATIPHVQRNSVSNPTFSLAPDVSQADKATIEEAISLASNYLADQTGIRVSGVEIVATTDSGALSLKFAEVRKAPPEFSRQIGQRTAPTPAYKTLLINVGGLWRQTAREDKILQLVHEYFHVAQHDLIGGNYLDADLRAGGPNWLLEGAALVFTDRALTAAGGPLARQAGFYRNTVYGKAAGGLLQELETTPGMRSPKDGTGVAGGYARAMRAVDSLLVNRDMATLLSFWQLQGEGMDWKSAFLKAFGETVEQFYASN